MPQLPDANSLGRRPAPRGARGVSSVRNAGAVGDAGAQLGGVISQAGAQEMEKQDRLALATARSDFLVKKTELDAEFARDQDFATQKERYAKAVKDIRDNAANSVQRPDHRKIFQAETDPDIKRGQTVVDDRIYAHRQDQGRADLTSGIDALRQSVLASQTGDDKTRLMQAALGKIDAAQAVGFISPQEGEQMRKSARIDFAVADLKQLPYPKQVEVLSAIEGRQDGSWFGGIPIEKRHALLEDAQAQVRAADSRARAEQSLSNAQAREAAATVAARLESGEDVPPEQVEAAAQVLDLIGDTSGAVTLRAAGQRAGVNKATLEWQPAQYDARIAELRAKGDKRNASEDVELDQLEKIAPGRISEFNRDPGIWAERNGSPRPPLDLADPKSVADRLAWQGKVARATGRQVPILSSDEVADLSDEMKTGLPGQLNVANQLANLPGRSKLLAAKQIAPSDPLFHRLVGLPKNYRILAISGAEARKGDANIVKPAKATDRAPYDLLETQARQAMAGLNAADANSVIEMSRNIAAGLISQRGQSLDTGMYKMAIDMALGAHGVGPDRKGGLGMWNNMRFVLPENSSQADFETMISHARRGSPGNAPVNPDGSSFDLKRAFPVLIGPNVYQWRTSGGGVVRTKSGQVFTISIRPK